MKRLRASGYVACMQIKHLQALIDKWAQHTVVFFSSRTGCIMMLLRNHRVL